MSKNEKEIHHVNIGDIEAALAILKRVNSYPLGTIQFWNGTERVEIDPKIRERFLFTGLTNVDFITSGYYKLEAKDVPDEG